MTITVESKFNVGDTVYVADLYHVFYPQKDPYVIADILFTVDIYRTMIQYEIRRGEIRLLVPEKWTFATYAECTKWCEEQNK